MSLILLLYAGMINTAGKFATKYVLPKCVLTHLMDNNSVFGVDSVCIDWYDSMLNIIFHAL